MSATAAFYNAAVEVTRIVEAVYLLASDRLAKTAGQILLVDGGPPEVLLR